MMANSDGGLRERLQYITGEYIGLRVAEQVRLIEELKTEYAHSISLLQLAVIPDQRTWNYNCHAFAFGLNTTDVFWQIRENQPEAWPTGTFVSERLLACLNPAVNDPRPGDVIVYFSGDTATHSGAVGERLIRSKWGSAHTWEHPIFEVPTSFGSTVRYFERPAVSDVVTAYMEFAKQPNLALHPTAAQSKASGRG
jgi:hypothetical protein